MHCRVIIAARICSPNAKRNAGLGTVRRREVCLLALEFYSEAHLPLAIGRFVSLIALTDYLAKRTVVGVGVRSLELRSVEEIEVIHLQNTGYALSEIKAFSYVGGLVVQTRATQL